MFFQSQSAPPHGEVGELGQPACLFAADAGWARGCRCARPPPAGDSAASRVRRAAADANPIKASGAGAEAGHGRRRAAWVHAGAREDEMVPAAAAAGVREAAEDLAAAGERAGDTVA